MASVAIISNPPCGGQAAKKESFGLMIKRLSSISPRASPDINSYKCSPSSIITIIVSVSLILSNSSSLVITFLPGTNMPHG